MKKLLASNVLLEARLLPEATPCLPENLTYSPDVEAVVFYVFTERYCETVLGTRGVNTLCKSE